MGVLDALWHVLGFFMPAAAVASLLSLCNLIFKPKRPVDLSRTAQAAIIFIVCSMVLVAGLLLTGRDGKMITYAAMVLCAATAQWALSGLWRRS